MRTLFAAVVALGGVAHAKTINETTVRGPHDVTALIGGWARVRASKQPQPLPQTQCESFLERPPMPNYYYYEACKEALAGRPQEALRLLGIWQGDPGRH